MANPINYTVDPFVMGRNGYGAQFSNIIYSATLAANTEATVTVPNGSAIGNANNSQFPRYLAVFSYHPGRNVYVALNATAAVPAGPALATTTSELLPNAKVVRAGDIIHFITATATTDISVSFYALPEA